MSNHKQIALIVVMILSAGAGGCAPPISLFVYYNERRVLRDIQEDQPWLGPDEQAQAFIGSTIRSLGTGVFWLEWTDAAGDRVALGDRVVKRCQRYLEQQGLWEQLRGERIRAYEQHGRPGGPKISREWLVEPSQRRYSANPSSERWSLPSGKGFEEVLVVVCLDPVVVVQGPGRIQWVNPPGTADSHPAIRWEGEGKAPAHFLLPHGFDYGTQVPYSDEPIWFSPDMDAPPQPATYVDEDTRAIDVPWGRLVLTRDDDLWRVDAHPKRDK